MGRLFKNRAAGEPAEQRKDARRRRLRPRPTKGRDFHKAILALVACHVSAVELARELEEGGFRHKWKDPAQQERYIWRRMEEEGLVSAVKHPNGRVYYGPAPVVRAIKEARVPKRPKGDSLGQQVHYAMKWLAKKGIFKLHPAKGGGEDSYSYAWPPGEEEKFFAEWRLSLDRISGPAMTTPGRC